MEEREGAQDEVDEERAQDQDVAGGERVEVATQAGTEEEAAGEDGVGGVSAVLERVRDRVRSRWTEGEEDVQLARRRSEEQNLAARLVSWWLRLALHWRMPAPV